MQHIVSGGNLQHTPVPVPSQQLILQNAMNVTWEPNKNYVVLVPFKNLIPNGNAMNMLTGTNAGPQHQHQPQE